ncbi:MAG: M20/M25/M40 family metallo-hydrolase [Planctomycetales bacterium]|nr:M20/M25/M40 family metallo-hydrolase [Planctomycetales bacterium]
MSALSADEAVNEQTLRGHIRFLSDDLLEGRGPATRGDELAQLYISTQLQAYGLLPGGNNGSWRQEVPLVGVTSHPPTTISFRTSDKELSLTHHSDIMLVSGKAEPRVEFQDAELVFVGYGIQAPEFQWDDFKDVDLRGKVLVIMNNDPEDDPELFAGRRRLYYGRWDYKYEMAARIGAAGALIIHTTPSAGYPFQVVQTSWSGEESELAGQTGPRVDVKGWLTEEATYRLMQLAGQDLDKLREQAQHREFRPVPLGIQLSVAMETTCRTQSSANILGILPGTDEKLRDEYVVFMAHHDHIGLAVSRDENGDNIYNGAIDNASGTASVLTIARAISSMPERPKRSILFAFVAAEEQGLLGSKYYAAHPTIHPGNLAAVINIDGINWLGKTYDLNLIGNGKSDLDTLVESVAKWQKRTVVPDYFPDRGYYYRSDQFSLAKVGVPGVYLHNGINVVGRPDGWGKTMIEDWTEKHYHQPSDEYDPNWDLAGALDDVRLLMHVGLEVAAQPNMPAWKSGDEFEAARKAAIAGRP